ncbi:MAG: hypothetical protein KH050_14015 [Clostridiaceae bacterium]|nr:hypothetical protein [Clostridiaceae bacterium]
MFSMYDSSFLVPQTLPGLLRHAKQAGKTLHLGSFCVYGSLLLRTAVFMPAVPLIIAGVLRVRQAIFPGQFPAKIDHPIWLDFFEFGRLLFPSKPQAQTLRH